MPEPPRSICEGTLQGPCRTSTLFSTGTIPGLPVCLVHGHLVPRDSPLCPGLTLSVERPEAAPGALRWALQGQRMGLGPCVPARASVLVASPLGSPSSCFPLALCGPPPLFPAAALSVVPSLASSIGRPGFLSHPNSRLLHTALWTRPARPPSSPCAAPEPRSVHGEAT